MKRMMKILMIAICCILSCNMAANAGNDKPIAVNALPIKAQTLLSNHFKLLYRLRWIILHQIVSDGLRNQLDWHFSLLAVNLCEIAFLIKFQLGSVLQNHIIALVDNPRLNGSKHHLLIVEMVAE